MPTALPKGSRLIFVGGSPRSGTTLVQNMLDSHPDSLGGPEFLHLPDIIGVRNQLRRSIARKWIDEFCSPEGVDQLTSIFVEDLLLPLADTYGCKFLSEKTPSNVLIFAELAELFPGARFIHVVRDPRAIIASMLRVGLRARIAGIKTQDFTTSTLAAIDYVRKCFHSGFGTAESAPEKVWTVVYEQLVVDPEGETKKICDFLGIEWARQMMHPGRQKHLGEKAATSKSGEVWYKSETYNRDPETREMDKWKRQLAPYQKAMIAASFGDFEALASLGYDFSVENRPLLGRVASLTLLGCRRVGYQFRRIKRVLSRLLLICRKARARLQYNDI